MTLEQLQAQRTSILAEIKRRGGAAKAPNYVQRLKEVEAKIREMRASQDQAAADAEPSAEGVSDTQAGLTTRQAQRLAWLLANRPNDPQVKELQSIAARANAQNLAAQPDASAPEEEEPSAEEADDNQVGLTPRQEKRLAYLKKYKPNDPQLKKLQDIAARAEKARQNAGSQPSGEEEPSAEEEVEGQVGLTPRQEARLAYLKKHKPNDPEIAKWERIKKQGGSKPAPKDNPAPPPPGGGPDVPPGGDPNLKKDGTEDPGTKGVGETGTTIDNFLNGLFENLGPLDLSGAPKILSTEDLSTARNQVWDSIYRQNTKDLDRQKALRMEETKQELAQRGIPIDFGDNNLYGRAIGDIDRDFDARDQAARDSANLQADQSLATLTGINNTNRDAFVKSAQAEYQSKLDAASTGGSVLNVMMQKYNIDRETAQKILDRKLAEKIAKMEDKTKRAAIQKAGSGGGGGGGGFNVVVGGEAP